MALQTVQLAAFAGGAVVITCVVDDASLDTSITVDPEAGDPGEPNLQQARVQSVTATNNGTRDAIIAIKGSVTATIPAGTSRTVSLPTGQRVGLAALIGKYGG